MAIRVFPIPFANVFIRAAELIGSFCDFCKSIQQAGHIRVRRLEILYFCIVLRIKPIQKLLRIKILHNTTLLSFD